MIDKSRYCIVYYDKLNAPTTRKSGTKIALNYAIKQGKQITVLPTKQKQKGAIYGIIISDKR